MCRDIIDGGIHHTHQYEALIFPICRMLSSVRSKSDQIYNAQSCLRPFIRPVTWSINRRGIECLIINTVFEFMQFV